MSNYQIFHMLKYPHYVDSHHESKYAFPHSSKYAPPIHKPQNRLTTFHFKYAPLCRLPLCPASNGVFAKNGSWKSEFNLLPRGKYFPKATRCLPTCL